MSVLSASGKSWAWIDSLARRAVHGALAEMRTGRLTVVESGKCYEFGERGSDLEATIVVEHPKAYRAVAFGGTVGSGEAYMDGLWFTDDLTRLAQVFMRNEEALYGLESGLAKLGAQANALYHTLRRNTRTGSRRNISEHYDLGNDFYSLFLDESMAYSCGVFEAENATMRDASEAKFERMCRKLQLREEDHLLEIGTGWGGFAIHAATNYGCRVTTTTISREQYDYARSRVADAGLSDRVNVIMEDYRDLTGRYDKLVSIEMIEAVGDEYYDTFFGRCSELLEPDGVMALQAITIADQAFERHRHEVDFIKRYIFPGSCIPSVTAMLQSVTRSGDLRLFDLDDITAHYVTTLRKWRESFWKNVHEVRSQRFSDRFIRMWEFYLCYCEAGFAERYLGNVQMVFVKPEWRG